MEESPEKVKKKKKEQEICYSERYKDSTHEYRHVILPPSIAMNVPRNRLLEEHEWRGLGVVQSEGWVHYAIHKPEPHILLFKRPLKN
jgi:cyclin-dependent kinase regulatory subunit CKS1